MELTRKNTTDNRRLRARLYCLQEAGITLNIEKCQFFKTVKFQGTIIDEQGIHADPTKTQAISSFPYPKCKGLAMLNEDGKPFEKVYSPGGRDE